MPAAPVAWTDWDDSGSDLHDRPEPAFPVRALPVTRRRFLWGALAATAGIFGRVVVAAAGVEAGERPRPVSLVDLDGAQIILPDAFRGKVVVIHFWASWCPYCLEEIDALESLFGQYGARGLLPVSIDVRESRATVTASLRNRKVTYPILLDTDAATARLYGVRGLPLTFVLDWAGAITYKVLGAIDREGLRRILSGML